MINTGTNMGTFGDREITEEILQKPEPELHEFVKDINKLNNEKKRSGRGWQQVERARLLTKQQREAQLKRDADRIMREFR